MNVEGLTNKQILFGALHQIVKEIEEDGHVSRATLERAIEVIAEIDRPKKPENRKIRRRIPATGYVTKS